jgi:hypothetical protein
MRYIFIITVVLLINSIIIESKTSLLADFELDNLKIEDDSSKQEYYECIIQNNHEYMATFNQFDSKSIIDSKRLSRKVYTVPLFDSSKLMDDSIPIKWKLIPLNQNNDTFFIIDMNHENDEFLCGSKQHLDFFKLRRKVNTVSANDYSLNNEGLKKCIWKFTSLNLDSNRDVKEYNIWNLYYRQALFSSNKNPNERHGVFLWNSQPYSDNFNWRLSCL